MDQLGFLVDDWKKIPQNYKYLILAGGFLIFNSWLLDHWGKDNPYGLFGLDVRSGGYSMGLSLIIVAFIFLISKQFFIFFKASYYRRKYPIDKLDKDFYLVWFHGKLMLFDDKSKTKKYFHIYPWTTAQDLLFVGKGFEVETDFMPNAIDSFPANFEGKMLKLADFKNGGSITTV